MDLDVRDAWNRYRPLRTASFCLVLLALPILGWAQPEDVPQQFAPNPSFETGHDDVPEGWTPSTPTCVWADDDAHSGNRSLKITSKGGATVGWTSAPIPVTKPGMQFILSAWSRLEEVAGRNGAFFVLYHLDEKLQRIGQSATMGMGGAQGEITTKPWTRYAAVSQLGPEVKAVLINLRLYGAAGTAWFDDVSLLPFKHTELRTPRALRRGITLASEKLVLCPGRTGALKEAARKLQDHLNGRGIKVDIVDPASFDQRRDSRDVIVLGNLTTNPLCEQLYLNYYTYEDLAFPGRGGHVLRPLIDPWGTGANILVLGVSGDADIAAATDAFIGALKNRTDTVDVPLTVKRGPAVTPYTVLSIAGRREMSPAAQYLKTGDMEYAKAYREMVLSSWFVPDKELFSSDRSLHLYYVTRTLSWDLMEACGVFSDAERLRITNQLLKIMRSPQGYGYSGMNPGLRSRENHATRAARAFYFGWRHFDKYYRDELGTETMLWRTRLHDFWKAPFDSSRSYEDSISQHAFGGSLDNTLDIAFMEPEWAAVFREHYARKLGERCMSICNNMGDTVLLGDTAPGGYPASVFAKLTYWLGDGRFQYMLDKRGKRGASTDEPLRSFAAGIPPVEPKTHIGLNVIPADRLYFETALKNKQGVSLEHAFDKLTIRGGLSDADEYLMLDGVAGGSHSYDDANSIGEYSTDGHRWLCEIDIFNGPTMSFHNAVTATRKGLGDPVVPQAAELVDTFETADVAYSATRLPHYNGVDWTRHLLWVKNTFTVVLDELIAREADDYGFVVGWRGLGDVETSPGRWSLYQGNAAPTGGISGMNLVEAVSASSGKHLRCLSDYDALFYRSDAVGDYVEIEVKTTSADPHELIVDTLNYDKRGIIQIALDGAQVGNPINLWKEGRPDTERHRFAPLTPSPGTHLVRFTVTGTCPESGGYMMAFSNVGLRPVRQQEDAPPPPVRQGFHLVFPESTSATLCEDRENLGKYLPASPHYEPVLRICEQSLSRRLAPGESMAFHNAFYAQTAERPREWSLKKLSEATMMLHSGDAFVFVMASSTETLVKLGNIVLSGKMACLGLGEPILHQTSMQIAGHPFDPGNPAHRQAIASALEAEWASSGDKAESKSPSWSVASPIAPTLAVPLSAAPLALATSPHPNDAECLMTVGTATGQVLFYDSAGNALGSFKAGAAVHALCRTDLEPDGAPEILAGSDDEMLYALSLEGHLLWKHRIDFMKEKQIWMWWTLGSAKVRKIHTADLTGDEVPEILVGSGNMHLNCLDNAGRDLWNFRMDHGICTTITTADVLGDDHVYVLAGNGLTSSNGTCRIIDASGKQVRSLYNGSWCTTLPAVAVGDPDGDGRKTAFCGTNRGNLRAYDPIESKPKQRWIHNTTRPISAILTVKPNKEEPGLVVAASESGYLCAFDNDGSPKWAAALSSAIVDAIVIPSAQGQLIVAACRDGHCFWLDTHGRILALANCGGRTVAIAPMETGNSPESALAIITQSPDRLLVLPSPK